MEEKLPLSKKIRVLLVRYFEALNMERRIVVPRYDPDYTPKWGVIITLFVTTFITTSIAGSSGGDSLIDIIINGLPFSVSLLGILLAHEMGHYFAARHFNVVATPPYFIPFPSIIGTMGAVIRIKSPIPDKRALLYIGAMGPLSGFIISCIVTIIGLYQSKVLPLPQPAANDIIPVFGDSMLYYILTKIIHGTIPPGNDVHLSPLAWAGWIGFLVTNLNLMPIGQLDGSHIIYALFGEKQRYAGWIFFILLFFLAILWPGWVVWIILTLTLLMVGHPYIPDGIPLNNCERVIGYICMVIFILTFIPKPVSILGQ
ncbi:MAG: site-2 protease family protein [Spirochaetes bacterium]|nr:site-2 protease family protein [Spirochaetota bacterium]